MVPVIINNRNRLTWPRAMVIEIHRIGGFPVILDNESTYPPLLDWYTGGGRGLISCPVFPLLQNGGSRGLWKIEGIRARVLTYFREYSRTFFPGRGFDLENEPFVYTDPDLDLSTLPDDTLSVLGSELQRYKDVSKAGLALKLDIPDHYPLRRIVLDIESEYYRNFSLRERILRPDYRVYHCPTDTTFALYRRLEPSFFYSSVRIGEPYAVRHLPWYSSPKTATAEEAYYALHCEMPLHSNVCPDRENGVSVGVAALKARYRLR